MSRYAASTEVSSEQSRAEIERTLRRYGSDGFLYGTDGNRALVAFRMEGRQLRFTLQLPERQADEFCIYYRGSVRYAREDHVAEKMWEQACRQRWRALALVIKAKLEAVSAGISVFEDEFLAHIVLPDGQLVGQWLRPQIESSYRAGTMPPLLPGPGQ